MCPSSPALVVAPVKSPDIGVSALLTWAQESNLTGGLTGGCDGANGDHKQDCIVLQCLPYYTGPSKKSWAASNSARAPRTVRVTDHEWPDGLREASHGPLSKPRGKRPWSISEIPARMRGEGSADHGRVQSPARHGGPPGSRGSAPDLPRRRLQLPSGQRRPRGARGLQGRAGAARLDRTQYAGHDRNRVPRPGSVRRRRGGRDRIGGRVRR